MSGCVGEFYFIRNSTPLIAPLHQQVIGIHFSLSCGQVAGRLAQQEDSITHRKDHKIVRETQGPS